ncbi:hypothetical protein BDR26DRAFT_907857 [Obelidium mucronatum]|nr:hypothetical protein BDR26DRAFT_907857 [Obelidium mucronatum]
MDFVDLQDRLLFGIPKKGRLNEQVMTLLQGADIQFHRKNRIDIALSTNHPIALVFLPAADIAQFVANGNVDLGITGQDMVAEADANVEELLQLGFGKCKLCVQAPVDSPYKSAKDLVGKRIATSFSSVVGKYFAELDLEAAKEAGLSKVETPTSVQFLSGSVEASCALGLADAIVDLVESGNVRNYARLQSFTLLKPVLTTQAHALNPLIEKIKRRIEGVIVAQKYALCTYNVPRSQMVDAKAPTISALETEGWVAVSVMVLKSKAADIMDELEEIGARDILITEIKNARMG